MVTEFNWNLRRQRGKSLPAAEHRCQTRRYHTQTSLHRGPRISLARGYNSANSFLRLFENVREVSRTALEDGLQRVKTKCLLPRASARTGAKHTQVVSAAEEARMPGREECALLLQRVTDGTSS